MQNPETPPWLDVLTTQVELALRDLEQEKHDCRPAWQKELEESRAKVSGWIQSLANPGLPSELRLAIEVEWNSAVKRQSELEELLRAQNARDKRAEQLVRPDVVRERLARLDEVLAGNNPTLGNLELSLHIDRLECFPGGKVQMRTCKLGILPEAAELLASTAPATGTQEPSASRTRRRGRLRVDGAEGSAVDIRALTEFAADTYRFAGLGDEWFWLDEFQIPDGPLSWVAGNAEAVFLRRQESKLSYDKLALEFGVSPPTIGAAICHYVETHAGARDEVCLKAGGKRGPRIDVAPFAAEARALWEVEGWSKERLAEKFGCSPPVINKALAFAYEQAGLPLPTRSGKRAALLATARKLLDEGKTLDEIAAQLQVSDVTARGYLESSFAAEGKVKPDLRGRRKAPANHSPSE